MEDDHVDRPGVEERQRLKLTGTNSSIGLIVLIPYAHLGAIQRIVARSQMVCSYSRLFRPAGGTTWVRRIGADGRSTLRSFASKGAKIKERPRHKKQLLEQRAFCRPGGYGGAAAPDPIPNSAVKRSSADGTSSQDAGE